MAECEEFLVPYCELALLFPEVSWFVVVHRGALQTRL